MRAHGIHTQYTGDHERARLALASERRAHERPVEEADLTFGEFLRRENLRKVDTVEFSSIAFESTAGQDPGVARGGQQADDAKFGAPRLGDVFPMPASSDNARSESPIYDRNGQTLQKATSGFVAIMVDVIA